MLKFKLQNLKKKRILKVIEKILTYGSLQHKYIQNTRICVNVLHGAKVVDTISDSKARTKIILMIDKINYPHVQATKTAKEAFLDTGLTQRVSLLKTLITTKLESSVEEYINTIITRAYKLNSIGLTVNDE